jgi:Kef-type K+ transport system membrane component KefB
MVLMGFSGTMDGLETNGQHLLGVILSISSTTIILKTFEELGKKNLRE